MSKEPLYISKEEWELIEDFLRNNLSDAQKITFDNLSENDLEFPQKINEVKSVLQGVKEGVLQQKMDVWQENIHSFEEVSVKPIQTDWKKHLMAASILLIIGLAAAWWILKPSAEEQLFAQFYKPDPGLATVMAETQQYDFEKAMVDYKSGHYETALKSWEMLLKQSPQNDTLLFFVGSAHLGLDQTSSAIKFLENVAKLPSSTFQKDACWYLGLALLKENQQQKALHYIEQSEHENKQQLISKIKNME